MNILLTGSHGLIGNALLPQLVQRHVLFHLVRRKAHMEENSFLWAPEIGKNAKHPFISVQTPWEKMGAVVHLAGANIAEKKWSETRKQYLLANRTNMLTLLAEQLHTQAHGVQTLIIASAVGYYNKDDIRAKTEASNAGKSFDSWLCQDIETVIRPEDFPDIRIVYLRFGVVLSARGGALKKLLPPFKMGFGGRLGAGMQPFPWVSLTDATRAIQYCLDNPHIKGAVNVVAPAQDTNLSFTKALGQHLGMATLFPLPARLVRWLFGEMGEELLLKGSAVRPKKLADNGFKFKHTTLADAFAAEVH